MDEEREKCKAFSSSTTLLWNTFSLSLVLPSFLSYSTPEKKAQVFKEIYRIMYKKKLMFVCVGLFLRSLKKKKKITTHIWKGEKIQKLKKKKKRQ